jgi:hypothetical protein
MSPTFTTSLSSHQVTERLVQALNLAKADSQRFQKLYELTQSELQLEKSSHKQTKENLLRLLGDTLAINRGQQGR